MEKARIKNALFYTPQRVSTRLVHALSQSGFRLFIDEDREALEPLEGTYRLRTVVEDGYVVSFEIDRLTAVAEKQLDWELIFCAFHPVRTYTGICGRPIKEYGDWPESFQVDLSDNPKASLMSAPEMTREAENKLKHV